MDIFKAVAAIIVAIIIGLGLAVLVSWGISAGISYLFGYTLGAWRTFVALVLIEFGLRFVSAKIRAGKGGSR